MAIVFFFLLSFVSSLLSEELLKKGESHTWEEISLQLPESVILKKWNRNKENVLKIYPSRNDSFFIVIRKLASELDLETDGPWKEAGFWKETNPRTEAIQKNGRNIKVYSADQVRNNNSLLVSVWFWKEKDSYYWIWLARKKEYSEIEEFWNSGQFFQLLGREP